MKKCTSSKTSRNFFFMSVGNGRENYSLWVQHCWLSYFELFSHQRSKKQLLKIKLSQALQSSFAFPGDDEGKHLFPSVQTPKLSVHSFSFLLCFWKQSKVKWLFFRQRERQTSKLKFGWRSEEKIFHPFYSCALRMSFLRPDPQRRLLFVAMMNHSLNAASNLSQQSVKKLIFVDFLYYFLIKKRCKHVQRRPNCTRKNHHQKRHNNIQNRTLVSRFVFDNEEMSQSWSFAMKHLQFPINLVLWIPKGQILWAKCMSINHRSQHKEVCNDQWQ